MELPKHILLIEDSPADARLADLLLDEDAPGSFTVRWVETAAQAEGVLVDGGIDAILLDMSLPDGEGLTLLERIRGRAGQTPIVVLTGRDDEALALEALGHGAQDYLRKADLRGDLLARSLRYAIQRGRVEAQLALALHEAERAEQAKGRFLARVSHEIRTPLNTITTMSQLLRDDVMEPEQRERTEAVASAARTLLEVVNDILDMAKIESGKMTLTSAPFQLRDALDDGVRALAAWAESEGLVFGIDVADDVPDGLVGDPARLRQVIVNLVSNAIKFTDSGRVELAVEVGAEEEEHVVLRFIVRDTGCGIGQQAQAQLFEAFTQVDDTPQRRHGGTGLGLAICAELVELMQGEIGVDSEPGVGSAFHFTARLRRSFSDVAPQPEVVDVLPMRLLLVDDLATNRTAMAELLRRRGHDVVEATDGDEAVRRMQETVVDAVLMDVEMPGKDGRQATADIRWRERETGAHLPIVGLSAYGTDDERQLCLDAGMDDFVSKPVEIDHLQRVLARVTGKGEGSRRSVRPVQADAAEGEVDWHRARSLADEDEAMLRELVGLFVTEVGTIRRGIATALELAEAEEGSRLAHALRGLLGQVGCESLSETIASICDQLKAQDVASARTTWVGADQRLLGAIDELRAFIGVGDTETEATA